jgi:hypothetical protein
VAGAFRIAAGRRFEDALKLGHIGGCGGRVEMDGKPVRDEDRANGYTGRLQLMAQRRQRHAQTLASGANVVVRPEHLDQRLAGLRALPMAGEIGEQCARLIGAKNG